MDITYLDIMREKYPHFEDCVFQLFDDAKQWKKGLAKIVDWRWYSKEKLYAWLEHYNKEGAWIYFSVNSMEKWNNDREVYRDIKHTTRLNSWVCDIDWRNKEKQEWWYPKEDQLKRIASCPVAPSLVVETKHWHHLYWFIQWNDGHWLPPTADNTEQWKRICRGIRNYFNWDRQICSDISRVLRVPGFFHLKDVDDPFLCEIVDWCEKYYTPEEMLNGYPNTETETERSLREIEYENVFKKQLTNDGARDRIREMDSREMLEKLSWSREFYWEIITFHPNWNWTTQIWCNWKSTGCRLDRQWKIWSHDGAWPNRTNWLQWYSKNYWIRIDRKEIYAWVKKEFPWVIPEKKISLERAQNFSKEVLPDASWVISEEEWRPFTVGEKTPFTWGLSSLDNKFWKIDYHRFIVAVWESWAWKTEYTLFQARKNADLWYKVCYISLEMGKAGLIERQCMKRAWVNKPQWDARDLSPNQLDIMKEMQQKLWNYPNLDIIGLKDTSLAWLLSAIRYKEKEGYVLFYIDNMGFIKWENEDELEVTKLASRELKTLTNELKISIVLLHHFNKGNSMERYAPRGKASIRWSGKIENDADYIFQVYRDFETWTNIAQILLEKDRIWWEPATVPIKFVKWDYEDVEDWF